MSSMTTVLKEFSDNGNARTYTAPGHTALRPRLVIQRRKVATGPGMVSESSIRVVETQVDADGAPIASKESFEILARSPISGADTAVGPRLLALIREIVASDEFAAVVAGQDWLSS